jgi:hypothetical protein
VIPLTKLHFLGSGATEPLFSSFSLYPILLVLLAGSPEKNANSLISVLICFIKIKLVEENIESSFLF